MKEFAIAYETVSSLSQEEAKEKLAALRRYLLPFEKEVPKDFFRELFTSVFGISGRDLSLVDDQGVLFIHLYNLTLRRIREEDLVEEEEKEYALYEQYRELLKSFPHVDIDSYDEEVVKFFAKRHREMVKELAEKESIEVKMGRCRRKPRLGKRERGYYAIKCYSDAKKDRTLAAGKEDRIIPLYAIAVAYWYVRSEK